MNKKRFAFLTALLFLADNFLWLVWQHFLNEGLYEFTFFLVWLPVVILGMTALFFFVFIRDKDKKRSPFYFIWCFLLCSAEFGVLALYHWLDLFAGERSPIICFNIIMAAFYFAAFFELAAFIDWKNNKKPAPASQRRLYASVYHTNNVPAAHTRTTVSGVAKALRIWAGAMSVLSILGSFAALFFPASDINLYLSFFTRLI